VTQIPALLGAMSAGLLVTRTTDDEHDKHLGDTIGRQLMAKPRVLLVASGLCALFAMVPGFPALVFLTLGFALFSGGAMLTPALRLRWERFSAPKVAAVRRRASEGPALMSTDAAPPKPAVPLLLELPAGRLSAEDSRELLHGLEGVLDHFQLYLGLRLPRIDVRTVHLLEEVPKNQPAAAPAPADWRLLIHEIPVMQGAFPAADAVGAIVTAVHETLRRHAGLFLGTQDANRLLVRASAELPDVVREVARVLPAARLAEILRRLVEEEVSIRNLRDILETLADAASREKDVYALTEMVRVSLKRQLTHRYAPNGRLSIIVLAPDLEEMLRAAVQIHGGVQQLALDPMRISQLMRRFADAVKSVRPDAIVAAVDIRRHVRKLIEQECFDTPVLSPHDLLAGVQIQVLHQLNLDDASLIEAAR